LYPPYSYESTIDSTEDLPELIKNNIRRCAVPSFMQNVLSDPFAFYGYPNPAENWLILSFQLPEGREAVVSVSDVLGNDVLITGNRICSSGRNEIRLDVSGLKPGLYF